MKLITFFIIAWFAFFLSDSLMAQSKKELRADIETLKMEKAFLQAKFDSAVVSGKLLHEKLREKTYEAAEITMKQLNFELLYVLCSDSIEKDSDEVARAIDWNDLIVYDQKNILAYETEFINTIIDGKSDEEIEGAFKFYKDLLYKTKELYLKKAAFDEKDIFRTALLELLDVFIDVAENEYAEMILIYTKAAEILTDADFDRWDFLTNEVDDKEGLANDIFLLKQKVFAAEYQFILQKTE